MDDGVTSLGLALGGLAVAVGAGQLAARGSAAQARPALPMFVYPTGSIVTAYAFDPNESRVALVGEFYVVIPWDGLAETYPTREEVYAAVLESRPATDSIKEAADASMVRDWRLNTPPPRGWERGTHFEVEVDDPATWRIEVPLLDRRPILGGRVQAMLLSSFPKIRGPRPVELPPEWTPEVPLRRGSANASASIWPPMTPQRRRSVRRLLALSDEALSRLETSELDRAAFGLDGYTVVQIPLAHLKPRHADYEQARFAVARQPGGWVPHLGEPIQVLLKRGVFHLDDGHHRYETARRRGRKTLPALVSPDDNPILSLRALGQRMSSEGVL